MRAPVQKTRPRRTGRQSAPETEARTPVGKGRPTHVRNRLIVAVAVVAAAIAGAGAPALLSASGQFKDSQDLVTLSERTQDALALAQSLADERDEVTSYLAAGRPRSLAPTEQSSARVDRQVEDLRTDSDTPADLRADLDGIATVRRSALTGRSSALQAHEAYSATIAELHRLAEQLAEQTPTRAPDGAHALAGLDSAVQQAAAARGLLLAALRVPTDTERVYDPVTGVTSTEKTSSEADTKVRDALTAAAQQARVRSDAALADFRNTAPKTAVSAYDATVTGGEVDTADKYLTELTDRPTLDGDDLENDPKKLDAVLSARLDLMRGAEASLYDRRTKDLEKLRDDDFLALEIQVGVVGALMLVAVGVATAMARSLTRPLSAVRRGAARLAEAENPAVEEPVAFTGRNDEFAKVVRSVNALHAHTVALHERLGTLEADRKHLVGQRQKMADAREELRAELTESTAALEQLRGSIGSTFVNLALRTLGLVERQLAVIEGLEEREQDPERLATLFKLDHFATVMRRHSENLLVLAGTEHVQQHPGPIPLVDVVRAAVSEIERYERVRIAALPPHAHVAGFAADDLSHLLAELMENATSFSPPDLPVEISGWLLENGEVMLSVQDEGIGMTEERLTRLNSRLAEFDPETPYEQEGEEGLGLGLYVVARLAHRLGVRVQLRAQKQGGVAAVVVLQAGLLAEASSAAVAAGPGASGSAGPVCLPGADAEANSNVLAGRSAADDPVVALAERAALNAEAAENAKNVGAEAGAPEAESTRTGAPQAEAPRAGAAPTEAARAGAPQTGAPESEAARTEAPETPSETTMALLLPALQDEPDPTHPETAPAPPTAPASRTPDAPTRTAEGAFGEAAGAGPAPVADAGPPATGDAVPHAHPDTPEPWSEAHPAGPAAVGTGASLPGHPADAGPLAHRPVAGTRHEPSRPTDDAGSRPHEGADGAAGAEHSRTDDDEEPLTAKGLPKRTPKITELPAQTPRRRPGSVDAEALRRRLGGFRRGAEAGYRDAESANTEETARNRVPAQGRGEPPATGRAEPAGPAGHAAHAEEDTSGGTVEEASS